MSTFKILNNTDDITATFTQLLYRSVDRIQGYGITDNHPLILESKVIWELIKNLKNSGGRVRYITDVNRENLEIYKKMMNIVDLRHMDRIKGGIIMNDHEFQSL